MNGFDKISDRSNWSLVEHHVARAVWRTVANLGPSIAIFHHGVRQVGIEKFTKAWDIRV